MDRSVREAAQEWFPCAGLYIREGPFDPPAGESRGFAAGFGRGSPYPERWEMKSSYCNGASACIDVEERQGIVYIRNTGNLSSPVLCTIGEWTAFLTGAKAGEFDRIGQGSAESAPLGELPQALSPVA